MHRLQHHETQGGGTASSFWGGTEKAIELPVHSNRASGVTHDCQLDETKCCWTTAKGFILVRGLANKMALGTRIMDFCCLTFLYVGSTCQVIVSHQA